MGRVVIPSAIRKQLGIAEGAELDVSIEGSRIVMSAASDTCVFCDSDEHVERFRSKPVCWSCMAAIRALDRERNGEAVGRFGI